MKKANWYTGTGSTKYANLPKLLFALCSAHLTIVYGENFPNVELFNTTFYFTSLFINTTVALIFIALVYRITRALDYFHPWSKSYKKRLRWQLACAVLFVQFLVACCAFFYYLFDGEGILEAQYIGRYIPLSALLLSLLSAFLFFEWSTKNKLKSTPKSAFKTRDVTPDLLWAVSEIACIFIEGKYYFAYNFNGEKLVWRENLTVTINQLPNGDFYLIRSSFIVNKAAIKEIIIENSRTTVVVLEEPLKLTKEVSRRENTAFKRWMLKQSQERKN